jgi:streptogramin lyase
MRKLIYIILILFVLVSLYLLLWPVPIEPVAWSPPEATGFTGPYAENNLLAEAKLYPLAGGHGPEDTAFGPDGLVYTGLDDGSIIRFSPDNSSTIETMINTGGRPVGYDAKVIHNLQDHTGHCHTITSVKEVDGYLWLGSLTEPHVARLPAP